MLNKPDKNDAHHDHAFKTAKGPMSDVNGNLSWLGRIVWFAVGALGGLFGMFAAWIITSSWTPPVRRQAVWIAWAGFAVQVVVSLWLINSGMMPGFDGTATQSTSGFDQQPQHTSSAFG